MAQIEGTLDESTGVTYYPLLDTLAHVIGGKTEPQRIKKNLTRDGFCLQARFKTIFNECEHRVLDTGVFITKPKTWIRETSLVLELLPLLLAWYRNYNEQKINQGPLVELNITDLFEQSSLKDRASDTINLTNVINTSRHKSDPRPPSKTKAAQ